MSDYSLPLQAAIVASLRGAGLQVYDYVPEAAVAPYVALGPSDENEDDADCIEGVTIAQQIDVWSRERGYVEAKRIAAQVRSALHRVELELNGARLSEIEVRTIRYLRDADGLTSHAAIDVRASIERTE